MAARNINLDMEEEDSSSDSAMAESVIEEGQQMGGNNLLDKSNSEGDTESDSKSSTSLDITAIEDVISMEDDFKSEWVDVFQVPLVCIMSKGLFPQIDLFGKAHKWKGIDWSNLFRISSNQVGSYFGYTDAPYFLLHDSLKVKYQFLIVDENDEVVLPGTLPDLQFLFLIFIYK